MAESRKNINDILNEATDGLSASETIALRRESEVVSLSRSDITDLLPPEQRAKLEAQAEEIERRWREKRAAAENK
ncbi:MAG: hypothetical protein ACI38Q_00640 [Candidatus Bruticola sp.]